MTEVVQEGFELLDVSCQGGDGPFTGELERSSFTFDVDRDIFFYECVFFNTPTTPTPIEEATAAIVVVWPVLDGDGDATTEDDWLPLQAWEFVADFGPAQIDVAHPVSDELGEAWWFITYRNDTPVEITELVPDGYRLADVQCSWAPDLETIERLPIGRDGNSVSWTAVVGTSDFHDFWCAFANVPVVEAGGATALPTLPPTDVATGLAVVGSDAWHLVLVGLAAVVVGVLVGSQRTLSRHH